jgi:hypothetical protein
MKALLHNYAAMGGGGRCIKALLRLYQGFLKAPLHRYAAMGGGGRSGGGADFSTFNEFKKGEKQDPRDIKFLQGAKKDVVAARNILQVIVDALPAPASKAAAKAGEAEEEEE